MHLLIRRSGVLFAGAALALALTATLAGQARAAQRQFQLHTQANVLRSLTDVSGFAFSPSASTDPKQRWFKNDQGFGFFELRNVGDQSRCLSRPALTNGGSLIGTTVRVDACNGTAAQQWKINPSGDMQHRASGLIAVVDLANVNQAVKMAQIPTGPLPSNARWHIHQVA
jgi:hypothetical protein